MTELSGKRIVMTGATGFIGSHVAKRFLDEGGEVYCLVRPESQKTDPAPGSVNAKQIFFSPEASIGM